MQAARASIPTTRGWAAGLAWALVAGLQAHLAIAVDPATSTGKYTGYGSCSSPLCHGNVKAEPPPGIRRDEVSVWVREDRHSRAFDVLSGSVARRMARLLGLGEAISHPRCVGCHTLDVPMEQRGRTFDATEGVSCESCHGPAASWLGPHTTRGFTREQAIELGMVDLRDPARRAERCLSCHLGTESSFVDHEMIAAGHPDLSFEIEAASRRMPRHWRGEEGRNAGVRARSWAVAQTVQLAAALRQLERRARDGPWPEYAELRCEACHHALTPPEQSWRQEAGYARRRLGAPSWDLSHYAVLDPLIASVVPREQAKLSAEIAQLGTLMDELVPDRAAVAALARKLASQLVALPEAVAQENFDSARTLELLRRVAGAGEEVAASGAKSAAMAAASLESLLDVHAEQAASQGRRMASERELRDAIRGLVRDSQDVSAFDPRKIAAGMRRVRELLGRSHGTAED